MIPGLLAPSPAWAGLPALPGNATAPGPAGQPMNDILDIKPPVALPPDWSWLWWAAAALAALALLALAAWWWLRRRRRKAAEAPPLPPDQRARLALDELEAAPGLGDREFYFRLSAVLRGYIEDRFGLNALEMTSEELLPAMENAGLDPGLVERARRLARSADPVKYAGLRASPGARARDLALVREFVDSAEPAEEPAENHDEEEAGPEAPAEETDRA